MFLSLFLLSKANGQQVAMIFMSGKLLFSPTYSKYQSRFLGPRMIYASGIVLNPDVEETLEQLQDNKLAVVCNKLDIKPTDKYDSYKVFVLLFLIVLFRLLDIGCGWGTLVAYAAKNYGCDATASGVTLAKNQTQFGTERIAKNDASFLFLFPPYNDINHVPLHRSHQTGPVFYAVTIAKFLLVPNTTRLSVSRWLG